jgi:hypothetical protein
MPDRFHRNRGCLFLYPNAQLTKNNDFYEKIAFGFHFTSPYVQQSFNNAMTRPSLAILDATFLRQLLIKGSFGQVYFRIYASFYPIATYVAVRPYGEKKDEDY